MADHKILPVVSDLPAFKSSDFEMRYRTEGSPAANKQKAAFAADVANAADKRGWSEAKIALAVSFINTESSFDPAPDPLIKNSSAQGLPQMLEETWHGTADESYKNGAVAKHNHYVQKHPELGLPEVNRLKDRDNPHAQIEVFLTYLDKEIIPKAENNLNEPNFRDHSYAEVVYAFYHSYNKKDAGKFLLGLSDDVFPKEWVDSASINVALSKHFNPLPKINPVAQRIVVMMKEDWTGVLDPAAVKVEQYQQSIKGKLPRELITSSEVLGLLDKRDSLVGYLHQDAQMSPVALDVIRNVDSIAILRLWGIEKNITVNARTPTIADLMSSVTNPNEIHPNSWPSSTSYERK
jgi:hypothetical protein